jgi:protein-tyrosine phosphatase
VAVQFRILVVCLGNVCRSPLAERVLRLRLRELLREGAEAVEVSSAGVVALVGAPMDQSAAAELRRLGGTTDGFVSRQLAAPMAEEADLVLTATRELRARVLEDAPRALKRTFTIPEFAALAGSDLLRDPRVSSAGGLVRRAASWRGSVDVETYDVPDPIGRPQQVHREVADMLDRDCTAIARAVVGALLSDATSP